MPAATRQTVLFRIAIVLYVVCIFALVGGYFAVSTMQLETSIYLQAPSTLYSGAPTATRGIVMDAPTGRLFVDASTTFSIDGQEVGSGKTARHGHLHATIDPPKQFVGDQNLQVTASHAAFEDFTVSVPIRVESAPPKFVWPEGNTRQLEDKKGTPAPWEGDLEVVVIPPDGEIPRGLPTTAYLLLVDAKTRTPVEGSLFIESVEGMIEGEVPAKLLTGPLGLAKLSLTATTSLRLTINAASEGETGEREGHGTVRFRTVASQFSIAPRQLIATPEQPVEAYVATLHRSGGLLADLYDGEHWVGADAFGISPDGSGARVLVPAGVRGPLIRLQVYQDLFEPGAAWDARWFVLAPAGTQCVQALRTVLDLHATHNQALAAWANHVRDMPLLSDTFATDRCNLWLDAALLAIPHHFVPAPLLVNTQKGDREELEGWRDETQGELMLATTGVLLVGFAILLLLVLQGLGRRQAHARALRELEIETASEEDLEIPAVGIDIDRWVITVQTIIIVLTIFTFGASLLMLLSWM